jgi:hypothetical protein
VEQIMSQPYSGFFEYRRERYDFDTAIASWDGRDLYAYASGDSVLVYFCGIPFGPVGDFSELAGQTYSGGGHEAVFSEGIIRFFGKGYGVNGDAEIRCVAANFDKRLVSIEFELEIALASGRSRPARGGIRCILGDIPELPEMGVDE